MAETRRLSKISLPVKSSIFIYTLESIYMLGYLIVFILYFI